MTGQSKCDLLIQVTA